MQKILIKNSTEMIMEKPQSSYRFERKFSIKPEFYFKFIAQLLRSGYSEIHHQRTINNIYLDDYDFSNVTDNVEGISQRKKTRIRWYGDLTASSKKTIEFKIKSDDVNRKENIPLNKLQLTSIKQTQLFWDNIKNELIENNNVKFMTNQLYALHPTLLNNYTRNYYLNSDESIRITIDKDLYYYSPIYFTETQDPNIIVEIKYNSEHVVGNNLLSHLSLTKYSKYVKGMLSTSTFKPIY